jgi:glucokinase
MFKFFAEKHPNKPEAKDSPTSEQVFQIGLNNPESLHRLALDLFVSIYTEFLGNIALQSLCYGGLYLTGSMTLSVAEYLRSPEVGFLKKYNERRPYLHSILSQIPIVVSKEVNLGLAGAFVYARRIVFDLYDHHA